MLEVDTLIFSRWLVPIDAEKSILENHGIAIQNGVIKAILPRNDIEINYISKHKIELPHHVVLPGLINTHTHAAMTLLRGLADDLPLMEWLNHHIWPAESTWVNEEFVIHGTQLAIAEMIKAGVTCFNDMYFFPNVVARTAIDAGMRASVGMIVLDFPTVWAKNADQYITKGIEVHDEFKNHGLISSTFAPHAPYTVSDEPLKKIRTLAEELNVPIHMHVHETADEVLQSTQNYGSRPLARLSELGLLSPRLTAVHMTQLMEKEIEQIANTGVQVIHCPESNLKLASGLCPVHQLTCAGVNVALGTDGAASNNDLDMFGELRTAALLAKSVAGDARAIPAFKALEMATINGARALGIDNIVGSLEIGKAADIIAVGLNHIECQPIYDPVSLLVYTTGRDKVTDVWIAGRQVLANKMLTTLEERKLIDQACSWRDKIKT